MATVDLSGYDLSELKVLQHDVEKEIKHRQQHEVLRAREQILAIAQEVGVPVDELIAGSARVVKKEKGQKVNPKYQNPADKSQIWTGRGRQPKWIAQGIAEGKSLNDFRI